MENTVFTLLFFATAPIMLMPSAVAMFARRKHRIAIIAVNPIVWAGLYYLFREGAVGGSRNGLVLPLPLALVAWLILLRFAIVGERVTPAVDQPD